MSDLEQSLWLGFYFVVAVGIACWFWIDSGKSLAFDYVPVNSPLEAGFSFCAAVLITLLVAALWPFFVIISPLLGFFWIVGKLLGK